MNVMSQTRDIEAAAVRDQATQAALADLTVYDIEKDDEFYTEVSKEEDRPYLQKNQDKTHQAAAELSVQPEETNVGGGAYSEIHEDDYGLTKASLTKSRSICNYTSYYKNNFHPSLNENTDEDHKLYRLTIKWPIKVPSTTLFNCISYLKMNFHPPLNVKKTKEYKKDDFKFYTYEFRCGLSTNGRVQIGVLTLEEYFTMDTLGNSGWEPRDKWIRYFYHLDNIEHRKEPWWVQPTCSVTINTDASGAVLAIGGVMKVQEEMHYFQSEVDVQKLAEFTHVIELLAIYVAVKIWGTQLQKYHVIINCDNKGVVEMLRKGCDTKANLPEITQYLIHKLARAAADNSLSLCYEHIGREDNQLADNLSKCEKPSDLNGVDNSDLALKELERLRPQLAVLECTKTKK